MLNCKARCLGGGFCPLLCIECNARYLKTTLIVLYVNFLMSSSKTLAPESNEAGNFTGFCPQDLGNYSIFVDSAMYKE